ncbi:cytochrome P450 [Xylariaceae sp. FL0662B]|nr:cytochrome P450 [Xylariaceae sp. FL0662B]
MTISVPQIEAALLVLSIPLAYLLMASGSEGRRQYSTFLKAFPVVGLRDEWFHSVRATFRSLFKTAEWASEGYSKFTKHDSPFLIPTMDRGTVIILPTEQMKIISRLPEDRLDIFGTLQEQIQAKYTVRDQRVVLDPYHRYLIPSQLTRELDVLTGPMITELEDGFRSSWGAGSGWREVTIWQGCFHVVARAANSALCGAPLCNDEKYLASLEGHSVALFGGAMLISITPKLLRPVTGYLVKLWCAYYARNFAKICAPYIEARIRETTQAKTQTDSSRKPMKDALQLIIDEAISRDDDTQLSASLISDRLLIANNVSLHSTTLTLHNLISSLITSDPSLGCIEALREECDKALRDAGGTWNLEAIRKLKLVDSAIRESMRVAPFASVAMARTVVDPKGISIEHGKSSVLVPQGTILASPMESIHCDEAIYPEARHFNPFRFVSIEQDDSKSDGQRYVTTKPTATPDDHFFGFGTGKNPCPGRFLAVHEIKLIVAYLLTNYDIEYTKARTQPTNLLAMKVPKMDTLIRVRRRTV